MLRPLLNSRTIVQFGLAILLVTLIACGSSATGTAVTPPTATATSGPTSAESTPVPEATKTTLPTSGGVFGGVIPMQSYAAPSHWGTHRSGTLVQIQHSSPLYNNLVEYNLETDDVFDLRGDLATSWELSDDGLSFVFKLAENATWMDGEKVTAADVVFSLDRMVETDKGPRPRVQELEVFYENSVALDPFTVQLNMKFQAPGLIPLLGVDVFKILPKHWVAEAPDGLGKEIWLVDNVMGSGPFILEEYDKDVVARYEKNPTYFKEGRPFFDGMNQFIITEAGTVIGAFKAGQVLMSNSEVSNLSNAEALQLGEDLKDKVTVHIAPACCSSGLMINTNKEPFTDPRVRRALNLAIHRQPIIQTVSLDVDQLAPPLGADAWWSKSSEEAALLPGLRELNGEKHPDDIAEARRLLAEAGFPDGFKTTITARTVIEYVDLAQLIKPQLKEFLNIDVDIKTLDSASGLQAYKEGNFDLAVQGHGFNVVGPDGIIAALYMEGGGRNYSNWSDSKIDELYALQTVEFDQEKRKIIVQEIDDFLLYVDTPWVPLYWNRRLWVVDNRIQNFHLPPSVQVGFKHEHLWLSDQ